MSATTLVPASAIGSETAIEGSVPMGAELPSHVAKRVLSGTSALTLGLLIERGSGFLANVLAARLAGATAFGAYSIAISTANNISTYAAGGIGSTAARFSGKYEYGGPGYTALARALAMVAGASALFAVGVLFLGAGPIAHLLHKPSLTALLQWAAVSAAGIIVLECARGFFVGQRRLSALVLLSVIVGAGMLLLVPLAASRHQPVHMIVSQGVVALIAVGSCLLLARPLKLLAPRNAPPALPSGPVLKEVWGFGLVQLAGLIGANLAGWWLTATVARADTTLVEMSFFTIASQLRNLTSLAPSLLTEGSYAVMADPAGEQERTPHRVMALCTFASTASTLLLASLGMLVAPWAVTRIYGQSYGGAAFAVAMGLAVAVTHMGNAPAAARLNIVSVRTAGVINTSWAVLVAVSATVLVMHRSSAGAAMAVFFVAHILSAAFVLLALSRLDHVPAGVIRLFAVSVASITTLALMAAWRSAVPGDAVMISLLMLAASVATGFGLFALGKRHGWLPTRAALERLASKVRASAPGFLRLKTARHTYGG